jgi:hypothetical protein
MARSSSCSVIRNIAACASVVSSTLPGEGEQCGQLGIAFLPGRRLRGQ